VWPSHALAIPEYNLDRDRRRLYGPSAPRGGRRLCPRGLARGLGPLARWRRAGDGPEPAEYRARRDLARRVRGHAASVARARRGDSDRRHRVLHHGALSDVPGSHEARGIARFALGTRHSTLGRIDLGTYYIEPFCQMTGYNLVLTTGVRARVHGSASALGQGFRPRLGVIRWVRP